MNASQAGTSAGSFQILAVAVVSRSGRPLFLKSFTGVSFFAAATREVEGALEGDDVAVSGDFPVPALPADNPDDALHAALARALVEDDANEAEAAQLLLYAALDRMDAQLLAAANVATAAAAAASRSAIVQPGGALDGLGSAAPPRPGEQHAASASLGGTPPPPPPTAAAPLLDSRGLAVFGRETRTRLRLLLLVRHGYAGGVPNVSECGRIVTGLLDLLADSAVRAWCDPFRDAAGDEPLAASVVYSPLIHAVFSAYLPQSERAVAA